LETPPWHILEGEEVQEISGCDVVNTVISIDKQSELGHPTEGDVQFA
jgi:hypothetical protein